MRLSVFTSSHRRKKRCFRSRVFLNEREVTNRCQVADDREGWVVLMLLNERGRPYIDLARGEIARERVHGRVRIVPLQARKRAA